MGKTNIEWTDKVWNCVRGCSRVSEGCRNCYAERIAARFSSGRDDKPKRQGEFEGFAIRTPSGPRWTGKVELIESKLSEPLHWKKPQRVFVNSMSDLFHEALPDDAIDRVFAVMALCPHVTFQVLTKRPERMLEWMSNRQTVFRVARVIDCIKVDALIQKTPFELRPIPGLDKYFIGNTGEVFTTHGSGHCVWCGKGFESGQQDSIFCGQKCRSDSHYAKTKGKPHEPAGRIMRRVTVDVAEGGYCRVRLIGADRELVTRELVHRLVLRTFDREPIEGEQGCHRDGNPARSHICNLRWGTQEDNWEDRKRHGNAHSYGSRYTVTPALVWPLENCWCGVSVEDQATADARIPLLLQTPAAIRFVSAEPLLSPVDLSKWLGASGLNWVICGGESGSGARPPHPDWFRSVRDQCEAAGVAFFFKQRGNWTWDNTEAQNKIRLTVNGRNGQDLTNAVDGGDVWMSNVGKKKAGALLDGREWKEFPK
jgi:protein gp37